MEKREEYLPIRMTKKEHTKLKTLAKFYGMTMAGYIRWKVFHDFKEEIGNDNVRRIGKTQ